MSDIGNKMFGKLDAPEVKRGAIIGGIVGLVGGGVAASGFVLPALETLIAASVLALGAVLALGLSVPLTLGATLCAAFAVAHGMAHGVEMPSNAAGLAYGLGFVTATGLLHGAGLIAGRVGPLVLRVAGAAIAMSGLAFLAA